MSTNTPNRGYTYPGSGDHDRLWEWFQELALDIDTDIDAIVKMAVIKLVQQAAQSLANGVGAPITFGAGSEEIITHPAFHSTSVNNSRVTPTIPGLYVCSAAVSLFTSSAVTNFWAAVAKNGVAVQPLIRHNPAATSTSKGNQAVATVACNGTTDYIEAWGNQTSGGALNTQASGGVNSVLEVRYLRPLP